MVVAAGRRAAPDLLAGLGLGVGHNGLEVLEAAVSRGDDALRVTHEHGDPVEAPDHLVDILLRGDDRVDAGGGGSEDAVAVGRLLKHCVHADQAARARLVLDHEGRFGVLLGYLHELAAGDVHEAAGSHVVHDVDRFFGISRESRQSAER